MLMTLREVCEDSRYSLSTWRSWIRGGRLPVVRLGRQVRVREEDYRALIEQNRVAAAGTADPRRTA